MKSGKMAQVKAFCRKNQKQILALLFVVVVLLPNAFSSTYTIGILDKFLIYTILAGSMNVLCGYCDLFCLGHMAFFCIGAYTSAILSTRTELPFLLILLLGGIFAAVAGLIVFIPIRNLSGAWLSLVTIGFSEIVRLTALNWDSLTGGPTGIKGIPRPSFFGLQITDMKGFYYLFLLCAILFLFATSRIVKSRVGYAWRSIKEDKLAAKSLGVEVMQYKLINFLYGVFWAGLAGALYAPYMMFIDSSIFTLDEGFSVLCMILIGGLGTIIGPVVGTGLVITLTESLRFLDNYRMVIYGVVIIAMMWVRPQGIFGDPLNGVKAAVSLGKRKKASLKTASKAE